MNNINNKHPYKIKDSDGNEFVYAGVESGIPLYRTNRGIKHIFDLEKYTIVENGVYWGNATN